MFQPTYYRVAQKAYHGRDLVKQAGINFTGLAYGIILYRRWAQDTSAPENTRSKIMKLDLTDIEKRASEGRNYDSPPLEQWHPELSGDIDITIRADGTWCHEGELIARDSIVRLFASILRREDDGEFYLVTPGEKWRIQVELHPLVVTDINQVETTEGGLLRATLNTGKIVDIGEKHPLFLEPRKDGVAAVKLPHGLSALFSRNAWYRLVDMAESQQAPPAVISAGQTYILG